MHELKRWLKSGFDQVSRWGRRDEVLSEGRIGPGRPRTVGHPGVKGAERLGGARGRRALVARTLGWGCAVGWTAASAALSLGCDDDRGADRNAGREEQRAPADSQARTTPPLAELRLVAAHAIDNDDGYEPSGLVLQGNRLLTVSDKHDDVIFEIDRSPGRAKLRPAVRFTAPAGAAGELDLEGLTLDAAGNFLVVSEAQDRVLRVPSHGGASEWVTPSLRAVAERAGLFRLPNAALEGCTLLPGGGLLLAAERDPRGFIELQAGYGIAGAHAFQLERSRFSNPPGRSADFSGLSVFKGELFALARAAHLVVKYERSGSEWKEAGAWSFSHTENAPRFRFVSSRYGRAEGLAIDREHVYVVLDNNGDAHLADVRDRRPWLFVFERPRTEAGG